MITKELLEKLLKESEERRSDLFTKRTEQNWATINISISWENGVIETLRKLIDLFNNNVDN